jgi:bifunctional UDP-N-acetylglucosamine pyrophosphorylase/glucosamine-1-phosphate N-acetyltransferase
MNEYTNIQAASGKRCTQAVILAAGKGTRMLPLTETRPKPLQHICGKSLIAWKLEILPNEINDIIIVIGYHGEQIRKEFGDIWNGKRIRYVVQEELNGTAGALWATQHLLEDQFIVMMGDDLYGKADIRNLFNYDWALGVYPAFDREIGGEIHRDERGQFIGIEEDRHYVQEGYIGMNLFKLKKEIFSYPPVQIPGRSEYGLPHTVLSVAKNHLVSTIVCKEWFQITTPDDLKQAEKFVSTIAHIDTSTTMAPELIPS